MNMLREHEQKRTPNKRTRFPGIVRAAKGLGVSRIHLYYVLIGERRSPRIERHPLFKSIRRAA